MTRTTTQQILRGRSGRSAAHRSVPRALAFGALLVAAAAAAPASAQDPLRVFISVDMEGIGGVGTPKMTGPGGRDYETARRLMTAELNAVIEAIHRAGPAEIVVNDSHGDHQNALHTELDPRVQYVQGSIKPLGMVAELDASFDAVIFLGYHARAGTPTGFQAHTGSGAVKGLWLNGVEVGEAGMNAAFAGAHGVPVVMAAGDSVFTVQIAELLPGIETVSTKVAVTPVAARLLHPETVRERLVAATSRALANVDRFEAWDVGAPVTVRLRLDDTTVPQIATAIPGVRQVDGYTVEFTAPDMDAAYRLIRLLYRFISV